jgi:hypothetical protein
VRRFLPKSEPASRAARGIAGNESDEECKLVVTDNKIRILQFQNKDRQVTGIIERNKVTWHMNKMYLGVLDHFSIGEASR